MNGEVNRGQENEVVVFLHIPKTAGTSLRAYLVDQFHGSSIFKPVGWNDIGLDELNGLKECKLVSGHFDSRILALIPKAKPITFLRNPIERTVSAILHAAEDLNFAPRELEFKNKSLEEIISDDFYLKFFANTQTSFLSSQGSNAEVAKQIEHSLSGNYLISTDDLNIDFTSALGNLDSFAFVGIAENFDLDLIALADILNFYPPVSAPSLNRRNMVAAAISQLDSKSVRRLVAINEYDIELYQYAIHINKSYTRHDRVFSLSAFFGPVKACVDTNTFLMTPFNGWGFHELEFDDNGAPFRWSGPTVRSGLTLKLEPETQYRICIGVWLPVGLTGEGFSVEVNELLVSVDVSKKNGLTVLAFKALGDIIGVIDLVITCSKVFQDGDDMRVKGYVLSRIDFEVMLVD